MDGLYKVKILRISKSWKPISTVTRLSEWCSDEIIYLDITKNNNMILIEMI